MYNDGGEKVTCKEQISVLRASVYASQGTLKKRHVDPDLMLKHQDLTADGICSDLEVAAERAKINI